MTKASTAAVYNAFDERAGEEGFEGRRKELLDTLGQARVPRDLAALPRNDLASSSFAAELEGLGAFRADVSGAGPAVYGLFEREEDGLAAAAALTSLGAAWACAPTWYG
jgi:4-diphosphocytidyl-2C-methyl-D-erythritol kinase